jgi:hypothetical protein
MDYSENPESVTDFKIYIADLKGDNKRILKDERIGNINIIGDYLYYINESNTEIRKMKLDGTEDSKICDSEVYNMIVFGDYIFPFRGDYYKYKLKKVGMYNKDGELYMLMPENEKEEEMYSINKVKELDPVSILRTIRENSDSYITQEQIDAINNSVDIYTPHIEPDDDILKKIIKTVIIQKQINPNNYKSKLDTKWSLTNLKSSLVKKQNLSMKNFVKWLDLLGCDIKFIVEDDGTDKIRPLKTPVEFRMSEERFGGDEYEDE